MSHDTKDSECAPPQNLGGWASNQIFQKGGLDRTSTFRGELLGKRGCFFHGDAIFTKTKLKSEIFNDKKSFSVITKNSNWEILPKNIVTFKRWDGIKDEKL